MQKSPNLRTLTPLLAMILSLAITLIILLSVINKDIPRIGHDYGYHIPRMLDGYLHQKINGLEVQWYTPSFGAGLPAYPNPQDVQFSLPQLLMHFVNPWVSLMISLSFYSFVGFFSFYLLLKDECLFSTNASLMGAIFILANGFLIQHAIVGHVGFQVFPLLGTILYILFSKKITYTIAGVFLGLIAFLIINQSGFYIAFIFILSFIIIMPLMYLITPHLFNWQRIGSILLLGGLLAMFFSASKLNAVYSFMRFFPREINDIYDKTYLQGIGGLLIQLMGSMATIPYLIFNGKDLNDLHTIFQNATGSTSSIWETDISISPVLILIVMYGILRGSSTLKRENLAQRIIPLKVLAVLFLFFGIWIVIDFSLAKGIFFEILKPIPIINSLHVNVRFASAFIFPMAFSGAYILNRYVEMNRIAERTFYGFIFLLTMAFLLLYLLPSANVYRRNADINQALLIYSQIEDGERYPVLTVQNLRDINVFKKQATNLKNLFEPIFGYDLEYFTPLAQPGQILAVDEGYYNMTNPVSYVFPFENGLTLFERFKIGQEADLTLFINRQQPQFKISSAQHLTNGLSLVSIVSAFVFLAGTYFWNLVNFLKSKG